MKQAYWIFTLVFLLAGAASAESLPGKPKNKTVKKVNKNKKKKFKMMFGY